MWEAIALGAGLAMDATAVSALRGLQNRTRDGSGRDAVALPLLFGVFQAGMAALGWLIGRAGGDLVNTWDHWIAFALLVGIGLKMIWSGWRGDESSIDAEEDRPGLLVDVVLAVATSIDAFAAGITLPLVPVSPLVAVCLIGAITAVLCGVGYAVGRAAGRHIGSRLELIGGVILLVIGARVLFQHL
ncbi:MAG: manganese efflux pump MntP family protein [Kofleriaceae bacterium]